MTYKEKWTELKDYLEYFIKSRERSIEDKRARTCSVNADNIRRAFWEAVSVESEELTLQAIKSILTTMECLEGERYEKSV